jgi:uncharacterized protein with GYD domain
LIKEGASGRKDAVEKLVGGLKGKLECIYYALGEDDILLIIDLPDNTSAAAIGLAVHASGMVNSKTTALLSVSEIDAACKMSVNYRPPKA